MSLNQLTPREKTKLKGMVKEAVGSKFRTDAESQLRKEIADNAKDELGIDKKMFNKLVNTLHKENLEELRNEVDEVAWLYELVEGEDDSSDSEDDSED